MLTMTQVHDIRKLFFEEGKNISEIARCTGHYRNLSIMVRPCCQSG
jgi:hypothetical protein